MKMQALYQSTKTDNTYRLSEVVSREHKCKCDQIPPAYPCENEKLVFVAVEGKNSKPDKKVVAFCKDLTPARAKNVAFMIISTTGTEGCSTLAEIVKSKGVNVIDSHFECKVKGGLFGMGKVADYDLANCKAWAQKVVDSLSE